MAARRLAEAAIAELRVSTFSLSLASSAPFLTISVLAPPLASPIAPICAIRAPICAIRAPMASPTSAPPTPICEIRSPSSTPASSLPSVFITMGAAASGPSKAKEAESSAIPGTSSTPASALPSVFISKGAAASTSAPFLASPSGLPLMAPGTSSSPASALPSVFISKGVAASTSAPFLSSPSGLPLMAPGPLKHPYRPIMGHSTSLHFVRRYGPGWAWTPWEPTRPKEIPPAPKGLDGLLKDMNELKITPEEEEKLKNAFLEKFYSKKDLMSADMKLDLILHKLDLLSDQILQVHKKTEWGNITVFGRKLDLSKVVSFIGLFK